VTTFEGIDKHRVISIDGCRRIRNFEIWYAEKTFTERKICQQREIPWACEKSAAIRSLMIESAAELHFSTLKTATIVHWPSEKKYRDDMVSESIEICSVIL
jgi:hypothetical protein